MCGIQVEARGIFFLKQNHNPTDYKARPKKLKSMSDSDYITRKELAAALEIGESTLREKEAAMGLIEARDPLVKKPIRYKIEIARTKLALYGHQLPD